MFSLDRHHAKVASVTVRVEHHGDELVNALTVKIALVCSNDLLSEFDPALKGALFKRPEDSQLPPGDFPIPRFGQLLGAIPWGYEGSGYTAHLSLDDLFDNPAIDLEDCNLDRFTFQCLENGRVEIKFNVGCRPNATEIGRVCQLLQRDVLLTLDEPEAEEQEQDEAA